MSEASKSLSDEKFCLFCDKLGHRTSECHSTVGLNSPAARELMRLAHIAADRASQASAQPPVQQKGEGMRCTACGEPYQVSRALAPYAAPGPYPTAMSSSACKCGNNTFAGTFMSAALASTPHSAAPEAQSQAVALIEECRAALAEELAGWDLDPPLHHVKQAHDHCVAWLARAALQQPVSGK